MFGHHKILIALSFDTARKTLFFVQNNFVKNENNEFPMREHKRTRNEFYISPNKRKNEVNKNYLTLVLCDIMVSILPNLCLIF